jgi:hypothetical protein
VLSTCKSNLECTPCIVRGAKYAPLYKEEFYDLENVFNLGQMKKITLLFSESFF